MSGTATLKSGALFIFRSVLRPADASMAGFGEGGILGDGFGFENTVHRYMIDRNSHEYFGYDAVIGAADTTGAFRVTFQPLTHIEQIDEAANLHLLVLPKYPAPQIMHNGETIELDLMVSPDGTRKLTDIIVIRLPALPAAKTSGAARDFTLDDGPITFDTSHWTFWKQGQQFQGMLGFTGKPGATLWVTMPGQGRYILSLTAHEGFTKSGAVRDNVVSFADAGQQYELRFQSPIAGAGKEWNLYVMHDVTYTSASGAAGVFVGTDRLDNLVAKR
jgi:hypothetical protein